jgi:hypothetical protein
MLTHHFKPLNGRSEPIPVQEIPTHRGRGKALRLLLRAHCDAEDCGRAATEFAVELADFRAARLFTNDLRWLVRRQHVEHLLEVSRPGAPSRKFRKTQSLAFSEKSCFVLTVTGRALAASQAERRVRRGRAEAAPSGIAPVPRWNAKSRELFLGDVLVRRFRTKATNQERILAAFQEEGWPVQIDDPLPPSKGESEHERRLHDAITKLNRHQCNPLIHFRGDGSSRGICWELLQRLHR